MARAWSAALWLLALSPSALASPAPRACNAEYRKHSNKDGSDYLVGFNKEGYTLAQHLKTIGITFQGTEYYKGYYATLTADQVTKVRSDCNVRLVEDDFVGDGLVEDSTLARRGEEKDAVWPLYYMSSTQKNPSDHSYHYLDDAGAGVDIYVMDSGMNHLDEFKTNGKDRITDFFTKTDYKDIPGAKGYGHGTPVGSAIAGNKYGIAKFAQLLNCNIYKTLKDGRSGPKASWLVEAIDKAVDHHNKRKSEDDFKGSVINMSVGFEDLAGDLDIALEHAYQAGMSLVGAAGNRNYQNQYPAMQRRVISVGAISKDYTPWVDNSDPKTPKGTNYGKDHVTLFAPGGDVPTLGQDNKEAKTPGTSAAAGYVSGAIAIFWSTEGKNLGVDTARARLLKNADNGFIDFPAGKDWKESPNVLANTGNRKGAAESPPHKYLDGPKTDTAAPPPASGPSPPKCNGVLNTLKWMGRDALNSVIPQFCATAEQQGIQDKNSGSLQRTYLSPGVDAVSLSIDWPSGGNFKPNKNDCIKIMNTIMDGCDGNDPKNPLNWKAGGVVQDGIAKFNIYPLTTRYVPGTCSFHVWEKETWTGVDILDEERHWRFFLTVDVKDGNGKVIGGTNGQAVEAGQGGGNPYYYNGLYGRLEMQPEAQGGDYIQFYIGKDAWTTKDQDKTKLPYCNLGAYDSDYSPATRQMDCYFHC